MSAHHINTETAPWVKRMARFGLIAKGIVYSLSGLLAILAVLHIGGNSGGEADKTGVFNFIYEQPMGRILLGTIALGLACYAGWRLMQGIGNTERKDNDWKGLGRRGIYVFSGLLYLSVAFYAGKIAVTDHKASGEGEQQLAGEVLARPFGQWLLGIAAGIMIVSGISQFHRALSGSYRKHVERAGYAHPHTARLMLRTGKIGYIARGIVWFVVAWLFLKSAYKASPDEAGDTGNVFQWLQHWQHGNLLMALVAAGLICYGLFMFARARYQPIHT